MIVPPFVSLIKLLYYLKFVKELNKWLNNNNSIPNTPIEYN